MGIGFNTCASFDSNALKSLLFKRRSYHLFYAGRPLCEWKEAGPCPYQPLSEASFARRASLYLVRSTEYGHRLQVLCIVI